MRITSPPAGDPAGLSLVDAAAAIRRGELSPVALTEACLARIEDHDRELRSFITVTRDSALLQASRAATEIAAGAYRGPLHGIPVALKDLVDTAGVRTTAGSGVFERRVPDTDAAVVRRLREAGAVLVGKTNLHEFAFGSTGLISRFGATCNPLDTGRIAGGSSSGSAASVAAHMCCAAVGTDTAGSLRLPAACCGVVALKPTYGAVDAVGVIPLSPSLDHVGPIARTARDAALLLGALLGDTIDLEPAGTPLRIGIARELFFEEIEAKVARAMEAAIRCCSRVASLRDVRVPAVSADRTVFNHEVWRYHQLLVRDHAADYQERTLRRVQRTEGVTAEQYARALEELLASRAAVGEVFADVDVILTPTSPVAAPTLDALEEPDELRRYERVLLRNTAPFNALGVPALTLPTAEPFVGLQLCAAPGEESRLLAIAVQMEGILGE
jgi:Asp-tRNA(Asn)/Glu-tRNA(Gln) amidotransferase A subunit family amidase